MQINKLVIRNTNEKLIIGSIWTTNTIIVVIELTGHHWQVESHFSITEVVSLEAERVLHGSAVECFILRRDVKQSTPSHGNFDTVKIA